MSQCSCAQRLLDSRWGFDYNFTNYNFKTEHGFKQ